MRILGIAAAAVLAVLVLVACGDNGGSGATVAQETATSGAPESPQEEQPLSPAEEHGRNLFTQKCGSCHTFDAAGTRGQIGPDLGDIPLNEGEVLEQIEHGGGSMPAGLVSGQDAQDVATFVANNGPGT